MALNWMNQMNQKKKKLNKNEEQQTFEVSI